MFFTNTGDRHYDCSVTTEVLRNSEWREATVQHSEAVFVMSPGSHIPSLMPIPQEGRAWRVKLVASRSLGEVEREVDWLFRCLKLEYPFGKRFQVAGPEMLNHPAESNREQLSGKSTGRASPTS